MLLRRALGEMLHSWGARVRTWSDGEALLDELPHMLVHVDPEHLPDTLITDYRLPGIDGLQLTQRVSLQLLAHDQTSKPLQTLIISDDTNPAQLARFNDSGLTVLAKPFRSERLLEQLHTHRHAASA